MSGGAARADRTGVAAVTAGLSVLTGSDAISAGSAVTAITTGR